MNSPLISLRGIGISRGGQTILRDVNLDIHRGDFILITGPNGGGKTTLLKVMLRLLRPDSGTVTYSEPNLNIGYLPQKNSIDRFFPITVGEVVETAFLTHNSDSRGVEERVVQVLESVGMSPMRDCSLNHLSGGQLQRTLLARAIAGNPELLVLDEPLNYLDRERVAEVTALLRRMSSRATIVLVSHQPEAWHPAPTRVLHIDESIKELEHQQSEHLRAHG